MGNMESRSEAAVLWLTHAVTNLLTVLTDVQQQPQLTLHHLPLDPPSAFTTPGPGVDI